MGKEITISIDEYKELLKRSLKIDLLLDEFKGNGYVSDRTMKHLFNAESNEEQED